LERVAKKKKKLTRKVSPKIQLGVEPLESKSKKAPKHEEDVNFESLKSAELIDQLLPFPKETETSTSVLQAVQDNLFIRTQPR
jgi:hypothetical protein